METEGLISEEEVNVRDRDVVNGVETSGVTRAQEVIIQDDDVVNDGDIRAEEDIVQGSDVLNDASNCAKPTELDQEVWEDTIEATDNMADAANGAVSKNCDVNTHDATGGQDASVSKNCEVNSHDATGGQEASDEDKDGNISDEDEDVNVRQGDSSLPSDGSSSSPRGGRSVIKKTVKTFPACLRKHLDNMAAGVQTIYNNHACLKPKNLKIQISDLTQELRDAKKKNKESLKRKLKHKLWMLRNHKATAQEEWVLHDPWSVYSLKKTNGEWKAEVWMSSTSTKEIYVNDSLVRRVLCPYLLSDERFTKGKFVPLLYYDRLFEVTETHFRNIRMVSKDKYELIDLKGRRAIVPVNFLSKCQSISKGTLEEAKKRFRQNDKKAVKIAPGSIASREVDDTYETQVMSDITSDSPEIVFQNGKNRKQVELCLPFALANGLYYLGFHSQAIEVLSSNAQALRHLGNDLKHDDGRPIRSPKVYHGEDKYDPLNSCHHTPNPVVAVLEGSLTHDSLNGPVTTWLNHCVCFVGDWLFDVNQDTAKKISRETLDQVTDLVLPGSSFHKIVEAREFMVYGKQTTLSRNNSRMRARQKKRKRMKEFLQKKDMNGSL